MGNNKEIAKILKESLSIVDELGNLDVEDLDDFDIDMLEELLSIIERAKKLKKNNHWKL